MAIAAGLALLGGSAGLTAPALAQSLTTGAISGVVTDPTGASVPTAKVTATNAATGASHSTQTQVNGSYLIPLLPPGQYTLTVAMTGFQTAKQAGVGVAVSTTGTLNFKLQVGASSQTVQVTGEAALLQPHNANTSTSLDTEAIANLPNPGGDITMLAQISPGAVMDVQGGGGTAGLSFNGVQGNAVEYTNDGMDDNDPFNNDNNSGPSNMLLGQNAVSEVTVNTNAYSVDQGRMASGQVNYTSKGGGNQLHGDAQWQWNGRALNAHDFFDKSKPVSLGGPVPEKPFDNVNNWALGVGGPIVHNKLFFFFDSEGTRIDLPVSSNFKVPTPAFESDVLAPAGSKDSILTGGYDTSNSVGIKGSHGAPTTYRYLPAQPGEVPWVTNLFKLYGNVAPGTVGGTQISTNTKGQFGCNLLAGGALDTSYNPQVMPNNSATLSDGVTPNPAYNPIPTDPGCYNNGLFEGTASTPETLTNFRLDWNVNANNTVWGKYLDDQGTQTTGTNPVNPVFDEDSFQPDHQGVLDWTHIFSPTLTNDFSTGFLWYSAIFDFNTPAAEHAAIGGLGEIAASPFQSLGSTSFPQGRNVTQYQFIDNMTWVKGTHSFKIGENFRREIVNDHDIGIRSFGEVATGSNDFSELMYGAAQTGQLGFPITDVEQFRDFSLDLYAGDTWQLTPKLTFTYGVRATHNSNAVDAQPYLAQFADFTTFSHSLATSPVAPFTAVSQLWTSVPYEVWQPRIALAWQPRTNTLIKAGWGMFSQVATASAAETLARSAPFDTTYVGGFGSGHVGAIGQSAGCGVGSASSGQCGYLLDPAQSGSAIAAAVAANAQFQANFGGGALSCLAPGVSATACVPPASITAMPANGLTPEIVYQYNFTVQQRLGRNTSLSVGYVGNHTEHNSYSVDDNGYETACAGCFAPLPYATKALNSPDPRFLGYSQTRYDGYGRYDSMQAGVTQRAMHGLTLSFNYTWGHCLTTGTPYYDGAGMAGDLQNTYVNCGNDIRQVANASYTYKLPFHSGNSFIGDIINNWQISGATFAQGGTPLFLSPDGGSSLSGVTVQATGPARGYVAAGVDPYSKNQAIPGLTSPGDVQWLNPSALLTTYDPNTGNCFVPGTQTELDASASASTIVADCQFGPNNGTALRGPGFQWTNLDVAKTIQMTERIGLRLDFQGYNVFNHPNFSNPDTTAAAGTVDMQGSDAINSMAAPNNGLLGQNGGDSAPRMLAFQAKIIF